MAGKSIVNCTITPEQSQFVMEALKANTFLTELYIGNGYNQIVRRSYINVGEMVSIIEDSVALATLNLDQNYLRMDQIVPMEKPLRNNKTLVELSLCTFLLNHQIITQLEMPRSMCL